MSRSRSLATGVLSAVPARIVALAAPLVLIPFALDSIGSERYGLWATVASVTAFSAFADLGIGNSLLTKLTHSYSRGEARESQTLILNAYVVAAASAVLLGLVAVMGLVLLGGSGWAGAQGIPETEVLRIIAVSLGAFLLTIPIALISRVRYATGAVAAENAWQAVTSLCAAAAFIVCVLYGFGPVLAIAAAAFAVPGVGALSTLTYFARNRALLPKGQWPTWQGVRPLLSMGLWFLGIGAVTALAQNVDLLVVSGALGLGEAAKLSVALRVTGILSTFFMMVSLPLWPAAGSALAAGDVAWVRRTTSRMVALAFIVVAIPGLLLSTALRDAIAAWIGQEAVAPTSALLLGLTAWNLALATSSPFFMVQNAAGVLVPQLLGWLLFLGVSVTGKLVLAPSMGLVAFPVVSLASFGLCVVPAIAVGYRRSLRRGDAPAA